MSIASKAELSVLSHEEQEMMRVTHHPAIYELDGEALKSLQRRLREQRGKMRTFVRQKRREARGKAEARGASFPGDAEQPRRRKQVFAAALKRVTKELGRLRAIEARTEHVEAARQALAVARAEKFAHHPAGDTPQTGPSLKRSVRRSRHVPGSTIGSIVKATKVAQARRDSRPSA
ncbi:hypothetical protein SAMN02990966_02920 [Rhodospirillales bacterium URHD0017]|nr:hypothetical protein SAMN02990966_02920 [Rhodospirillales bacterium URHD0017]